MSVYKEIRAKKITLDEVFFNTLLDGFAKNQTFENRVEQVEILLKDMKSLCITKSNYTFSILIRLYTRERLYGKAILLYDEMVENGSKPGVIVYTNLMQACIKDKKIEKAIDFYEKMKVQGIQCDKVCY